MINAKAETLAEKRTFAPLLRRPERRALLLADGWFEWLAPEAPKQPRQPMYFTVDGGEPFAFPALWSAAKVEGEWIHSVVLITTEANAVARSVHERMPVVLQSPEEEEAWLGAEAEDVLPLLRPLPSERLDVRPANPALNKVGGTREGPQLLTAPQTA